MALVDGLTPALPEGASAVPRDPRGDCRKRPHQAAHGPPGCAGRRRAPAPELSEQLPPPATVRTVHAHDGALDEAGWDDLIDEAMTGEIAFPRGGLCISPTPAMTLIDVDGSPPCPALALAAVPAIAAAILRLDIGGSIGIDFPTLAEKRDRQAVDAALAENWLRAARRPAGAANAPQ
jgi:hypothetical protein